MQVTKEDRIFKSLALLGGLSAIFINISPINTTCKLAIILPIVTAMLVLGVRKYLRDKRDGKPLTRYYLALGFIILSVLFSIALVFYMA